MGTLLSRLVFIGLCICTFTGCATLIFDRYDKVDIVTQPTGVEIYDSEGFNIGIMVGNRRLELRTSCMSSRRSKAELIAWPS